MYKNSWDKSYLKNDNTLYYPDENLVRFVNKYIHRRIGHKIKRKDFNFLDVGCGAGRNIAYLVENGYNVTGIDISKIAINQAKKFLNYKKIPKNKYFLKCTSSADFFLKKKFFDVIISCASLDSMPTNEINQTIKKIEILLKKKGFLYVDLMGIKQKRKGKFLNKFDQIVKENHEKGTIQSYWNLNRIKIKFKNFKIINIRLVTTKEKNKITDERYYCIFKKI
tara:strand:- start:377 stop:1045 length:669 start_codon:yes stop_codon:yes gene_type:complete